MTSSTTVLVLSLLALSSAPAYGEKPYRRIVPNHAVTLLDGCSADDLTLVARTIDSAINSGAPAYNEGRIDECFRTYERTALTLGPKLQDCAGVKAVLEAGLARAETFTSVKDKAWVLRDTWDGLISVIARNAAAAPRTSRPRKVPTHPASILDDCPLSRAAQIEGGLADAISLGAPAYNEGDVETCFKIYQQTAISLDRRVVGCVAVRQALLAGIKDAATLSSFADKAWAMRDAFDGVLEVISRTPAPVATGRTRRIPDYDVKVLDQCSPAARQRTVTAIQDAITFGAPLFDSGSATECHALYKKTVADLRRTLDGCVGIKEALRAGVADAKNHQNDADKAWALRDVFDGLLKVLSKR